MKGENHLSGNELPTHAGMSKWASHSDLATTLKYLYTNESYEHLEMDRMLANEKANEKKVVSLDEYRKAS